MGTCLVDALEGCKVITVDVLGAFLQANLEEGEDYYVKFTGEMVKMLCRTDASYCDQIIHDKKGRKYLYSKLTKAVYGTLIGSKRWFDKLTTALREWGFEPNKYDECCWNKMVGNSQLTVVFHVDNLKCSCRNKQALDELFNNLQHEFGEEQKLQKLEREVGPVHDYQGLRIDYSIPSKVIFTMYDYIKDIIVKAPDDLKPKNCTYLSNNKCFM